MPGKRLPKITQELSAAVLAVNTIACSSANNLRGFDAFAIIVAILSPIVWFHGPSHVRKPLFFGLYSCRSPCFMGSAFGIGFGDSEDFPTATPDSTTANGT
jgi:hypothetical protein